MISFLLLLLYMSSLISGYKSIFIFKINKLLRLKGFGKVDNQVKLNC